MAVNINLNVVPLTAIIISLLALGINVPDMLTTPKYYCEDRQELGLMDCESLSSTAKTCYTLPDNTGGKRCSSAWQEVVDDRTIIPDEAEVQPSQQLSMPSSTGGILATKDGYYALE